MKSLLCATFLSFFALITHRLSAQDTLPDFTVKNRLGKIILSWVNAYPVIKQISIQRSSDSTKGFKTILTVPDPTAVTNGFLDVKAPDPNSYYKLYILLDNGKYLFSKSHRAVNDSSGDKTVAKDSREVKVATTKNAVEKTATDKNSPEKTAVDNNVQTSTAAADLTPVETEIIRKYDLNKTTTNSRKRSDGLRADSVKAVVPKDVFVPSSYVFTNPDGNITIAVPDIKRKAYQIKFYEDDGTLLFEVDKLKENIMILDKVNFMHSGWFRFELYENGVMKEKHKFLIPKDIPPPPGRG